MIKFPVSKEPEALMVHRPLRDEFILKLERILETMIARQYPEDVRIPVYEAIRELYKLKTFE